MTKVCFWDRYGSGLSSKGTGRETAAETTADLMTALKAARLKGPYVVVGHSLGAYEQGGTRASLFWESAAQPAIHQLQADRRS